ncbi:NAD(P)/FAD-dependent oxidoreductase [Allosalinactinospora lopnorensis]|uniref:NAD(P)/FAD-dependent oxidoreductase n=1 Tax=Allosalinactinospora lopnorensis TaxID=1352348 RepID=UPI000623FD93|nr:FAD-dependent oxidoreductase [Allosalinactinospora lopnorensis]
MNVVVIGGGVIGLYCALELLGEGVGVTVIDDGPRPGTATPVSAGWVVPSLSAPLSGPGVAGKLARQIVDRRCAFGIRPAPPARLARWLWEFARSGTDQRHRAGLRAVLSLANDSVDAFRKLSAAEEGMEMHHTGVLLTAREPRGLSEAVALLEEARAEGYSGDFEILDQEALVRREPALAPNVLGAVHARAEAHLQPETLRSALIDMVGSAGALRYEGTAVQGVERADDGRWNVVTSQYAVTADRVVIAAGVWSTRLLDQLGVPVPLLSGTGHTVTAEGMSSPPRHALKLMEPNIAIAPFNDGVRIAGRFELGGPGDHTSRRSAGRLLRAAAPYLKRWDPSHVHAERAGMRPATPDSMPLIGRVPGAPGVFAATGHGMLGLTLAPGTASALAPLVVRGTESEVLRPFALDRFRRRDGTGRERPGERSLSA